MNRISADDVSASIVTIKNSGSSLCMGASGSTSWDLTMQACDTKPAPNLATVFVYLPGKSCGPVSGTKFASLSWNARFTGQGRAATDNTPGDDLTVTSSPGACVDRLWLPTPS